MLDKKHKNRSTTSSSPNRISGVGSVKMPVEKSKVNNIRSVRQGSEISEYSTTPRPRQSKSSQSNKR